MHYIKALYIEYEHQRKCVFLMFLFVWNLNAQSVKNEKWDKYIETTFNLEREEIKSEKIFFLVTTEDSFLIENCLKNGDSICRILDRNNFILESTQENITEYIGIVYIEANNLWKIGAFHPINNSNTFFSIKTSKPFILKELLVNIGVQDIVVNDYVISAKTSWSIIQKHVLPLEYVTYVGSECLKPIQESIVKDLDLSVNGVFKVLQLYPELNESDQTIGLKDNLPKMDDIDLLNKIKTSSVASSVNDDHSTDMSTIISGKGNSGANGLGVLPSASIFPMDFNNLFPDDYKVLNDAEVSLINNSYGTLIENYYGVLAEAYDQFMYDNPTKLHVFSSGNSGALTAENGIYQNIPGYGNLTGNFKMSKNCITVGAIDQNENVLSFSSKGPAYDGRVKPEIVAYSILGTSNSTALVTGVLGTLQETYIKKENKIPSASLLKAALLNGADDVDVLGVDFKTGYGSLNAVESLKIIDNQNYIEGTIESNEVKTFNIDIPADAIDLKVMLVWTDVPALPNDNFALKNDLDITISEGNTTFFPSILDTTPTLEAIEKVATTGVDVLNPVEQIVISDPEASTYTIILKANNLETIGQDFSLVYTWKNKDVFEWIYPVMNANMPYNNGGEAYIRWKPTFEQGESGSIEVSYDDDDWEVIAEGVNLNSGFYNWELPEGIHSEARLRFVLDDSIEVSDSFNISTGVNVNTSLNCEDITEITWNKKDNTSQYRVYNLQNNEMELINTVSDTSFVFSKNEYPSPYFSIAPLLENSNTETLRSETVNTQEFSENCYFDQVFASIIDRTVSIEVSLSSLHNIKSIEGFRVNESGSRNQISSKNESDEFLFDVLDNNPIEGENTYQFKVTTNDDDEYFSQETSVRYFSVQNPFLVFPNPTTVEKGITVFSGLPPNQMAEFELYDVSGHLVFTTTLSSDVSFVTLNSLNLTKGLYICKIVGSAVFSEKIVIE